MKDGAGYGVRFGMRFGVRFGVRFDVKSGTPIPARRELLKRAETRAVRHRPRRADAGPLAAALAGTLLLAATLAAPAWADEQSACTAAAGSYLTGVVVTAPKFAHGQFRHGVELSHTHVSLRADQDGRVYDVAMDNVYANGYQKNSKSVPAPLNSIRIGDHLDLCGQLYTSGVGIHWVHSNCGATPTAAAPDGWVKQLGADGAPGANDEGNTKFCSLF